MTADHVYEPSAGHGLAHDPLNAIVAPRPIGWISTRDGNGVPNLAPYSFFNLFNYTPPILGFASTGWKDSVRNIEATGEFAWNLVTRPLAEAMNATGATVPPDVDEFGLAGLTAAPCRTIAAPRVAESPVCFECRLSQLIPLKTATGAEIGSWLVLGEVVTVHIDKRLISDEGVYVTTRAQPILRGGGPADYFSIGEDQLFRMRRPE